MDPIIPDLNLTDETLPLSSSVKKTSNIPSNESKLYQLGADVSESWKAKPLGISYITQPEFGDIVVGFKGTIDEMRDLKAYKNKLKSKFAEIIDECLNNIPAVRSFMNYKYDAAEAESYFTQVGFVKNKRGSFVFPTNRKDIKNSLEIIPGALTTHGYANEKNDAVYWAGQSTKFNVLYEESLKNSKAMATKSSEKKKFKAELSKHLRSIVKSVQSNNPDEYKSELRAYGFLKETL
jgi:hypothetical protein